MCTDEANTGAPDAAGKAGAGELCVEPVEKPLNARFQGIEGEF